MLIFYHFTESSGTLEDMRDTGSKYIGIGIVLLFLTFIFPGFISKVQAQDVSEKIRSYDVLLDIQQSGELFVTEKIEYDFGTREAHGIFRDIPYKESGVDEKTQKSVEYKMKIDVTSVKDEEGSSYKHIETTNADNFNIRVGDPNKTISGIHMYIIEYTVSGALDYFADHDELYWDAIGTDWDVPIDNAHITASLSSASPGTSLETRCLMGTYGSINETDCVIKGTDFLITRTLQPREGVSIVVGFPKGLVAELLPERVTPFFETFLGKIVGVILVFGLFLWYVLYPIWIIIKWFKYGRDPDFGPAVTAYFEGPKNASGRELTPAESGALIDEIVHVRDISATLVDLARRGYFKIEERDKNEIYFIKSTKDFKTEKGILNFERTLLDKIFSTESDVKVKDLKLYSTIQDASEMIYNGLVDDGFFPTNPNKVRTFYGVMAGLALTTMNIPLLVSAGIFGRLMPRKTEFGTKEAQKVQGLLNFLKSQSTKLEFEAKEYFHLKNVQTLFEKLLPFAVAFGVEKIWMERFKNINLSQPEWYSSYRSGNFSSMVLADSLNSSMKNIESAATPPRSSTGGSSGFSSGGFSGGGGGGGGGGSW
jgi:hypothetical protein